VDVSLQKLLFSRWSNLKEAEKTNGTGSKKKQTKGVFNVKMEETCWKNAGKIEIFS
jgi:hypothetical protein